MEKDAGFDRRANLRAVDRHEINELAGVREAKGLHREHAGGLRQRLDDKDARHDRTAWEMTLEELLVYRHGLDRDDRLIGDEGLDPIDKQQGVAMWKRRHHPLHIKRTEGGAFRHST